MSVTTTESLTSTIDELDCSVDAGPETVVGSHWLEQGLAHLRNYRELLNAESEAYQAGFAAGQGEKL